MMPPLQDIQTNDSAGHRRGEFISVRSETEDRLPVLVLSGFLGAGKSTLLNHLLKNRDGLRLALIVNDLSAINIDAELVQQGVTLDRTDETLVEMSNGCICCTLRDDLLTEIERLASLRRYDYLIVESTGVSEPMPVAETFAFVAPNGVSLSDVARLDAMVTVVDASQFLEEMSRSEALAKTGAISIQGEQRSLSELLATQVEFANVILLNKSDLVSRARLGEIESALTRLNPEARLIITSNGAVAPQSLFNTHLFDLEKTATSAGWLAELEPGGNSKASESDEYGIGSYVFRARIPFHPGRLLSFFESPWTNGRLLRCKGFFWNATALSRVGQVSQAGPNVQIGYVSTWWQFVPADQWPVDEQRLESIRKHWAPDVGDCRQEMVFIGQGIDKAALRGRLDACLLTIQEIKLGVDGWGDFVDALRDTSEKSSKTLRVSKRAISERE